MLNLTHLIEPSNDHIRSKFGFGVEKTRFFLYDSKEWAQQNHSQNKNSFFYRPSDFSLHINKDDPYFHLNFLSGYFGHGLFYENTLIGREICSLKYLELLMSQNENKVKNFSLWVKDYLSGFTGNHEQFKERMSHASKEEVTSLNNLLQYEQKFSEFGLFYSVGLPKKHSPYNLKKIVSRVSAGKNIKLALVYGSRKEHSDLDVFVVSNEVKDHFQGWLDLHAITQTQFEFALKHHDIAVLDPLFSGSFVLGNQKYYESLKRSILNNPITSESIQYNLRHSEEQRAYANRFWYDTTLLKRALKYQESYLLMASELNKGNLRFTLKDLLRIR